MFYQWILLLPGTRWTQIDFSTMFTANTVKATHIAAIGNVNHLLVCLACLLRLVVVNNTICKQWNRIITHLGITSIFFLGNNMNGSVADLGWFIRFHGTPFWSKSYSTLLSQSPDCNAVLAEQASLKVFQLWESSASRSPDLSTLP